MKHILLLSSLLLALPVFAANMQEYKDDTTTTESVTGSTNSSDESKKEPETIYQDPTGIQTFFNTDGSIQKILASGEAELDFGDKKDERQALQKATLRAKAAIAKFLNETIKSTKTLEEIQKTVGNATAGGDKTTTRSTVETQVEMLENKAEALLRGVVTLQQDIDRDKKLVTVTVGMKEETIQAAKDLQGQIASSGSTPTVASTSNAMEGSESGGREIRRSKAMENF